MGFLSTLTCLSNIWRGASVSTDPSSTTTDTPFKKVPTDPLTKKFFSAFTASENKISTLFFSWCEKIRESCTQFFSSQKIEVVDRSGNIMKPSGVETLLAHEKIVDLGDKLKELLAQRSRALAHFRAYEHFFPVAHGLLVLLEDSSQTGRTYNNEDLFYNKKTHQLKIPDFIETGRSEKKGALEPHDFDHDETMLTFQSAAVILTELACGSGVATEMKRYLTGASHHKPKLRGIAKDKAEMIDFFITTSQEKNRMKRAALLVIYKRKLENQAWMDKAVLQDLKEARMEAFPRYRKMAESKK